MKSDWMNDELADAAGAVAFAKHGKVPGSLKLRTEAGRAGVRVARNTKARGDSRVRFLRFNLDIERELAQMSEGPVNVVVQALIRHALDDLRSKGQTLIVEQA
jgi:hypothetical protein